MSPFGREGLSHCIVIEKDVTTTLFTLRGSDGATKINVTKLYRYCAQRLLHRLTLFDIGGGGGRMMASKMFWTTVLKRLGGGS